ncbi:MAG: hypothetical protein KC636_04305, partial [Myxococcales bacterium]|nr:hypothetical protein [Myxococcales bacterium]
MSEQAEDPKSDSVTADAARGAERPATQAVAPAPVMGAVAAPPGSSASEPEGTGARLVEADASEAAGEAEASARPRRRKRRRRRKKKPTGAPETAEAAGSEPVAGEGEGEGEAAPAATDSEPAKPRAERPAPTGPFHQFLTHEGEGGRRHTFASGSIVAGRVERIDDGVITLDLFGKGHAVMEVTEPRVLAGGHPEPELGPTLIHGLHTPPVVAIAREAWTAVADPEGASAADAPATSETAPDLAPPSSEAGDLEADAVETALADGSSEADDLAADAVETAPAEGSSEASDVEADAVETSPADAPAAPAAPLAAASLEAAPEGARADALEPPSDQEEGADTLDAGVDEAGSEDVLEDSDAAAVDAAPVDTDELDDAEDEAAAPAEEPAPTFVTDSEAPRFAGAAGVEECAPPQPGDIIGGRVGAVSESGHMVIVNREVDRLEARRRIKEARDGKRRVAGLVFGFNRGGFD